MKYRLISIILVIFITISAVAQDDMATPPDFDSWEAVLEAADGTIVNWHMWGGSDGINEFVDTFIAPALEDNYGVTLNRVPITDTVDAVNMVIEEFEDGMETDGSVDMIWINGENFWTLRQAELLYGPWAEAIPNSMLVDWDNPSVNHDFGNPVDGYESALGSTQFQFIYDTARMSSDDLPTSYADLTEWMMENPGRFTYVQPGDFLGTRFIKQALFEISGGGEQWQGEFNQELYDEWTPQLWELLNDWEPFNFNNN